jgi:hypothetical protein
MTKTDPQPKCEQRNPSWPGCDPQRTHSATPCQCDRKRDHRSHHWCARCRALWNTDPRQDDV